LPLAVLDVIREEMRGNLTFNPLGYLGAFADSEVQTLAEQPVFSRRGGLFNRLCPQLFESYATLLLHKWDRYVAIETISLL